jgi:DNA mismatch repair protein MutL
MGKIKVLDKKIIEKIAAGEVVERPASIVKELVENSIDAGSQNISIEIKNAGIDLIKIEDDGTGIGKEDLPLTIQMHATSKLHSVNELESIGSLGFRGEALASIAAVSEIEIVSALQNSEANKISNIQTSKDSNVSNNSKLATSSASRSQGTTIIVKNLFGKIPARRKFLKSEKTEERVIRNLLKQFFINFPEISFKYILDEKIVYNLTPSSPKERITALFNFQKDELIDIQPTDDQIKISGIIVHPKKAKRKSTQHIYVNERSVKSSLISSAVKKAYADKMPPNLYPNFFLNIDMPRSELDVNIHPRKEEVRFSNEKQIFVSVLKQIKETLNQHLRQDFESKFKNTTRAGDTVSPKHHKSDKAHSLFNRETNYTPSILTPKTSKPSHNYVKTSIDFSQRLLKDEDIKPSKYSKDTGRAYNFLQVFNTFIIIEKDEKLLIIDQHAADERINFEKIKQKLTSGHIESTPLLIGEVLEIEKDKLGGVEVDKLIKGFSKLGFEVKNFGDSADKIQLKIEAIPITLSKKTNIKEIVENIIIDFDKEDIDFSEIEKKIDLVCATMSCHSSIRGGDQLSSSEIQKLLDDLWSSDSPYTCPHGRPIFYEISKKEMEKNFLRI